MKKIISVGLMMMMVLGLFSSFASTGAQNVTAAGQYTIEQMVQYAYEDESKAIAEYEAIIAKFGENAPFKNILKAEARHLAAVEKLAETLGIKLEAFDAKSSVVVPATLEEAYKIGVQAEKDNIAMYEQFLKSTALPEEAKGVFTALMKGSQSHQKAYERQLDGTAQTGNRLGRANKNGTDRNTTCELGLGQGQGRGQRGQGQRGQGQNQENCVWLNK